MCNPELTKGLCQICTGTLTPENTHVDSFGNTWDVHKGVCAIEAGDFDAIPLHARVAYQSLLGKVHSASTPEVRRIKTQTLSRWLRKIGVENHEPTSDTPE